MGLGRAARPARGMGVGQDRAPAGRGAGPLRAWRGVLCPSRSISRTSSTPWTGSPVALGGLTRRWRFDRMSTVVPPGTGEGHRLVRRGGEALRRVTWRRARRGAATARVWWRRPTTSPRNASGGPCPTTSPSSRPRQRLDTVVRAPRRHPAAPHRRRERHRGHPRGRRAATSGAARAVPVRAGRLPATVSAQALVAFRGNRYSVPPELARATVVTVQPPPRLPRHLDIATCGRDRDRPPPLAPTGAGATIRDHRPRLALTTPP